MTTATRSAAATVTLTMENIVGALIANLNPFLTANKVTVRSPADRHLYKIEELRQDGYFAAHAIDGGGQVDKTVIELLPCSPYFLGLILNQWSDFNAAAPPGVVGMVTDNDEISGRGT